MPTIEINPNLALNILREDLDENNPQENRYELIEDEIFNDKTRWEIHYSMVFHDKETDKYYETCYSVGATEHQDTYPFDDEIRYNTPVVCQEVIKTEVVSYEWKPV